MHSISVYIYIISFSFQIPERYMHQYIAQVLGVIVALLEDPDESVQLTAVQCLLTVSSSLAYKLLSFFFLF